MPAGLRGVTRLQAQIRPVLNAAIHRTSPALRAYISGWVFADGTLTYDQRTGAKGVELYADELDGGVLQWMIDWLNVDRHVYRSSKGIDVLSMPSDVLYDFCLDYQSRWPLVVEPEQFFCGWFHGDGNVPRRGYARLSSVNGQMIEAAEYRYGPCAHHVSKKGCHQLSWSLRKQGATVGHVLKSALFRHRKSIEL